MYLSSKNIISSKFSFTINPENKTSSFKIGNNFNANFILIIELSLSFPKVLKSFLSIIFFCPILKYLVIYLECSKEKILGIKQVIFIPFKSIGLYLKIFSISLFENSIVPSFPLSPLTIIIPVSLLNKIE